VYAFSKMTLLLLRLMASTTSVAQAIPGRAAPSANRPPNSPIGATSFLERFGRDDDPRRTMSAVWNTVGVFLLGGLGWLATSFVGRPFRQFFDLRGEVIQQSVRQCGGLA
jgi:hypothetical protein